MDRLHDLTWPHDRVYPNTMTKESGHKVIKERCPSCFADLTVVFPMTATGLRETPRSCMICVYKTECLRSAMEKKDGMAVREEAVDRAYNAGMMGFLERWSRKKMIHRRRSEKKGGK